MALRVGDYVKQQATPEWGVGRVVSMGESEKVTIFFLGGGKRIFYDSSPDLERVDSHHAILDLAGTANWEHADRNLYVVELNPNVFDWERRFLEANCTGFPGRHCVYVGATGLTPEERFRAHLRGEHCSLVRAKVGSVCSLNFTNTSTRFPMNWHSRWSQSWRGNCAPTASPSGRTKFAVVISYKNKSLA